VVQVEGFGFRTIASDDPVWRKLAESNPGTMVVLLEPPTKPPRFVKLLPPASASQDDVSKVREFFESHGADVQVILPREAQVVLEQAMPAYEDKGIRETVTAMAEESNSRNKPALRTLLESAMVEVGL